MAITEFAVHKIDKTQDDAAVVTNIPEQPSTLEDSVCLLLNELSSTFATKVAKRYGQFSDDVGENPLPAWTKHYLQAQFPFATYTQKMSEHWAALLEQTPLPFEGYLLYWVDKMPDADWLNIAHIQHQSGFVITDRMSVSEMPYMNASSMGFCCRMNLNHFQDASSNRYLTVSKNRGEKFIQTLFLQWVGFTDTVNSSADTAEFLNIVEAYTQALPEDDSQEYRSKVVDFCIEQDSRGEPVEYKELSQFLDEAEPDRFEQFVRSSQETPKDDLIPDKSQLKKYTRFGGRSKEISVQFSASLLGQQVEFDPQTEQLIIRKLPKSLLNQLKKHQK